MFLHTTKVSLATESPPKMYCGTSYLYMRLAEVWEGKQKKFEQIGYVVLVVFEVQFLNSNLVQVWEQRGRTAL